MPKTVACRIASRRLFSHIVDVGVFFHDFQKQIGAPNTSPPYAEARDAGYEGARDATLKTSPEAEAANADSRAQSVWPSEGEREQMHGQMYELVTKCLGMAQQGDSEMLRYFLARGFVRSGSDAM